MFIYQCLHKCQHFLITQYKIANIFSYTVCFSCTVFFTFVLVDAGKSWLSTTWKLCKPLKTSNDVKELKSWLSDVYTNLAMINYPYPTNFLAPVPANPISVS